VQGIIEEVDVLNLKTANRIAEVRDLDAFWVVLDGHVEKQKEIGKRLAALSKEDQEQFQREISKTMTTSRKIEAAIDAFQSQLGEKGSKILSEVDAKAADQIAAAADLAAFEKASQEHAAKRSAVTGKFGLLTESQQEAMARAMGAGGPEAERLNAAVETFHKRLREKGPNPKVLIITNKGPIKIELYESLAPITVKNFLRYVDERFYDGTIFHRVIGNFMIQGGGFVPGMREKSTHANIKNEAFNRLGNQRGTIAMARTSEPDSASSQFYINVADNKMLDRSHAQDGVGYTVFGKVIEGMDVVDRIKNVATTNSGGHGDVPIEDVVITSIRRLYD